MFPDLAQLRRTCYFWGSGGALVFAGGAMRKIHKTCYFWGQAIFTTYIIAVFCKCCLGTLGLGCHREFFWADCRFCMYCRSPNLCAISKIRRTCYFWPCKRRIFVIFIWEHWHARTRPGRQAVARNHKCVGVGSAGR